VTVIASDDATITIDANHPMAGKDLTFELELISIG
jgi:peptidylprolyl isomerase